jgi:hypothetical protein
MKKLLFVLMVFLSVSAYAQMSPENLGREFVKGLSMQKEFDDMNIFFNENDFNVFIAELKANPQIREDIKKTLDDPKEIETSRNEFRKDRAKLQEKWENALETIRKENLAVAFEKIESDIMSQDGMKIYKIRIFYNFLKGDSIYRNLVKIEGTIVGGRLIIAVVKSFEINLEEQK